jgi:hypothetical protein
MQILSRSRTLVTLVCLFITALATLPLAAAAQAAPGKVLFYRSLEGTVDDFTAPVSSAIFSIDDNGHHERLLTPYALGIFNMDGIAGHENLWLTNAFSPNGKYSVYLEAYSVLPHYGDTPYYYGKYYIINAYGERTSAMFYGTNDLQPPSEGPGYGSVSWGPAGNDQIAYANVPDNQWGKHPACVRLMHSNGSDNHVLWCADRWKYCAVEALRWSGDGGSLLAYAVHSDHLFSNEADLYLINAFTGAGTLVEANISEPGWGAGDISYDGHEVVYQVTYDTHETGPCHVAGVMSYIMWCAKNMLTGQTAALADPNNVVMFVLQSQVLLSPDGAQAFLYAAPSVSPNVDSEIYAVNTDGSGLRKVTSPCVPRDANTSIWWYPVRLSPDGTQMLANCHIERDLNTSMVYADHIMVTNLADGSARFVTNGVAYDWHTQ